MDKNPIQNIVQALTLAGLGLYSAVRYGQQLYCNRLGTEPEEIGLTYIASISRAAVILIAILAPLVLILVTVLGNQMIGGNTRFGTFLEWAIFALSYLAVIAIGILVGRSLGDFGLLFLVAAGGFTFFFASMILAFGSRSPDRKRLFRYRRNEPLTERLYTHRGLVGAATLIGFVVVSAFFAAGFAATRAADDVQRGRGVAVRTTIGLLGIRAYPVSLTGTLPKEPDLRQKAIVYLGQSGDTLVLYDAGCSNVIRTPKGGVTLEEVENYSQDAIVASRKSCPK